MRHIERVDFNGKGIAMSEHGRDPSQEKSGWKKYSVNDRNKWAFGLLTLASFLTLQTLIAVGVGQLDIALKVALLALAVALPLNALLVVLAYGRPMDSRVRTLLLSVPAVIGTLLGIDAVIWHVSWVGGVVFIVVSVLGFSVAFQYLRPEDMTKKRDEYTASALFPNDTMLN